MSWLSKGLKKAENWVSNIIPHTGQAEKRANMAAAQEQINYYKQAKEDLVTAKNESEAAKKREREKISKKELRGRQRVYKRAGFLQEPSTEITNTLG
jgi:hypothetical protein